MHKYNVGIYHMTGDIDSGSETVKATDDPKEALKIWCQEAAKHPTCAYIDTWSKANADELISFAKEYKVWLVGVMNLVDKFPYKQDYIIDAIYKKAETGCTDFNRIDEANAKYLESKDDWNYIAWDSIHPFCCG